MKTNLRTLLLAAIGMMFIFSSCNKFPESREVFADSYINSFYKIKYNTITKQNDTTNLYNVMHSAFSYAKLTSVAVKNGAGISSQLTNYNGQGFSFYTPIDTTLYKTTIPAAESLTYTAQYENGEIIVKTEDLTSQSLAPPRSLLATKGATAVTLTWKAVPNVQAYKVKILTVDISSNTRTSVYESDYLYPTDAVSNLSLPFSLVNLTQFAGSNLSFEVSAFIFESDKDNFQAVSTSVTPPQNYNL